MLEDDLDICSVIGNINWVVWCGLQLVRMMSHETLLKHDTRFPHFSPAIDVSFHFSRVPLWGFWNCISEFRLVLCLVPNTIRLEKKSRRAHDHPITPLRKRTRTRIHERTVTSPGNEYFDGLLGPAFSSAPLRSIVRPVPLPSDTGS